MSARGTTYGALTIAQRCGAGFDEQAVTFLEDFAHRVAVTLDTTRALAESRRVATVLSRELVPPSLPDLAGATFGTYYRVAYEQEALGGDFYDVHGDDDGWTVVVGDVCGKGVEAAVLTGKVRQAVRTASLVDRDPRRILDLANRTLVSDSDETFVTAVCAHGRQVGDVLHLDIASAGHPEPLVVRRDGSVEQVPVSGTVLGLLAGHDLPVGRHRARRGRDLRVLHRRGRRGPGPPRPLRRRQDARGAARDRRLPRDRPGRERRRRAVRAPARPGARRHRDPRRAVERPAVTTDVAWAQEVEEYLSSLKRGDRSGAMRQARTLRSDGHDLLALILRLIAPAQSRVGELWVSDSWSVAQEHAATAISEAVLTTLAVEREGQAQAPADAPSVVVSCVEQEWHALPALMVTEQLRASGFAVSYLGANSSAQGLVRHIHDTGPSAVLLSCALSSFLPLTRREIEAVRETGTPVVVGGSAFDAGGHRARVLGATAFATGASDVAAVLAGLPTAVPPAPPLTHAGAEEAFVVFADRESLADDVSRLALRSLGAGSHDGPTRTAGDGCSTTSCRTSSAAWRARWSATTPASSTDALAWGEMRAAEPRRPRRHRSRRCATRCGRRCTTCPPPPGCSTAVAPRR